MQTMATLTAEDGAKNSNQQIECDGFCQLEKW